MISERDTEGAIYDTKSDIHYSVATEDKEKSSKDNHEQSHGQTDGDAK